MVLVSDSGDVRHPLTDEVLPPQPLYEAAHAVASDGDLRSDLAAWITSDENPYFARVIVNRVWAEMMGVGLVEPVDDLRATNPPSNPKLLDALAEDFRRHDYDLKALIRRIANSYVYRLSSLANTENSFDTRNYSRHYRQRLRAETLWDAITEIAGGSSAWRAMPAGARSTQIWSHRVNSVFLDTFGRPDANQDPPCERTTDTTVSQALHLMNSPELHQMVTAKDGRAQQLADSELSPAEIVEQLYLWVYTRYPDAKERQFAEQFFAQDQMTRSRATQDLMWALVNTPEFLFKD